MYGLKAGTDVKVRGKFTLKLLVPPVVLVYVFTLLSCWLGPSAVSANPAATTITPLRVGQVDVDMLYDRNRRQFEANIAAAIDYLKRSNVNTVFLEAHADDEGTGNIEEVYFSTRHAPVKADVFRHVVERLHGADFRVYAWMSTLAGQWLTAGHPEDAVKPLEPGKRGWYRRATPFSPRVRGELVKLVNDLAVDSPIDGVIFNDDLYFNDFEDYSPAAKAVFRARFGHELTPAILKDPAIMREWTSIKTKVLNDLTLELMAEVRKIRPNAASARNIYPVVILDKSSEEWFAQNYADYLNLYDYTVVMAYPRMEKVRNAEKWLQELTQTALADPGAAAKVIFKLQGLDWSNETWIGRKELERQVQVIKSNGAVHIAYYPVNVLEDRAQPLPF